MCTKTIKFYSNRRKQRGFTLLEMAIGMIILGLLIAPALTAYNLYEKNRRIEQSAFSLDQANKSLEGYLGAFGRYPCPASRTAAPGDPEYGFESRNNATGACIVAPTEPGVLSVAGPSPNPNPNVLIGALPYKTLNLQENEIFDGYGARLTYAVSDIQTNATTYSPSNGRIRIEKMDDASGLPEPLLNPPNSAHYVVISHGYDNEGSYTAGGALSGNCANTLADDVFNCDDDAVFRFSEKTITSDDIMSYIGGKGVTPWQYEDNNTANIHLKTGGQNVITGRDGLFSDDLSAYSDPLNPLVDLALDVENEGRDDQIATDCSSLPFTTVCLDFVDEPQRTTCAANLNSPACLAGWSPGLDGGGNPQMPELSDGIVRVQRTMVDSITEVPGTGGVISDRVCDYDGNNCFNPNLIGGFHNPDPSARPAGGPYGAPFPNARYGGTTAPSGTGDGGNMACPDGEVMVGIQNGQIVCSNTVTFTCPSGDYMAGFNTDGEFRCGSQAQECPAATATNACGGTVNLPVEVVGGNFLAYSGECYEIADFDDAYADTFTSYAELDTYVNDLNDATRTQTSCNLVRDNFRCEPNGGSGAWEINTNPSQYDSYRQHETRRYSQSFRNSNNSSDAEGVLHSNYQPYNPSSPMAIDPNNNNGYHDCWCREDYRIQSINCSSGTGNRWRVRKNRCPSTSNNWAGDWELVYDTGNTFCTCVPGTGTQNGGSCASRIPGSFDPSGVTGNTTEPTTISCPYSETGTGVYDFSACTCPNRSNQVPDPSPTACPAGTTNSFTFEGQAYNNVSYVEHRRWTCPTVSGDLDTAGEVGFWTTTSHTEPCACDDGKPGFRTETCPSDQLGQRRIETRLDCSVNPPNGAYVDVVPQNILQECRRCEWTQPTAGSASYDPDPVGKVIGSTCNCNTDTGTSLCRKSNGSGWDVFGGCTCDPV